MPVSSRRGAVFLALDVGLTGEPAANRGRLSHTVVNGPPRGARLPGHAPYGVGPGATPSIARTAAPPA
jgi:hypothetical protein